MQGQVQMMWIVEQWLESILQIKVTRRLIYSVNFHGANANFFGQPLHTAQCVDQQQRPQAQCFLLALLGKSG